MSKSLRLRSRDQRCPRLLLAGYQRPVPAGRQRLATRRRARGAGRLPTVEDRMRAHRHMTLKFSMLAECGRSNHAVPKTSKIRQPGSIALAAH